MLLNLPHFDIIRFHTIDPIHNIFLGIAKHTSMVWKETKVLNTTDFETLQNRINSLKPPPNIGRIPRKIESGFAKFTADQLLCQMCITKGQVIVAHSLLLKFCKEFHHLYRLKNVHQICTWLVT